MPIISTLRAAAFSAALLVSSCTTPAPAKPEALTAEAAAEAMFADALERPKSPSAPFDTDLLQSLFGDKAAITWSAAGPDAASGAYRLADVRVEILGEAPFTFLTADEVLLWNADIGALVSRLDGQRLGETLSLFDRVEMSGATLDLTDYLNAVQEATSAAMPAEYAEPPAMYADSTMTIGKIVLDSLTLHPWTFEAREDGDEGIEGIRLLSALARSVSLGNSVFIDSVVSQNLVESGVEGKIDSVYDRQMVQGYDRGNIAAIITSGTIFTAAIPVPDVSEALAEDDLPTTTRLVEMAGSSGYSSWTDFKFANLLAWGEKGEMPPITERDLMSFGASTTKDVKLAIGGQPILDIGRMDFAADEFAWFLPERIVATHENASFDLVGLLTFADLMEPDAATEDGEPSIKEIVGVLERTGLGKISGDGSLALTWDSETGAAVLENKGVTDNIFSGITRLDFVLPSYAELVPAFGADGITPNEGALDDLLQSAFAFSGARYSITDVGGLNAFASLAIEIAKLRGEEDPAMAGFADSTPEGMRAFASGMVMFGGGAVSAEVPQAMQWLTSLSKFISDGGTIELVAAPAKPVTMADLTGMGPDAGMVESPDPAALVELLGVTVTHTPPAQP